MAVDPDQLDALAGNVAAIYREAETALTRALQRLLDGALDRDLQGPAWLTEQLAKVTTLRRAADRVQAAVREIAEPEIRAALASAYRAGSSAATTTILAHLDPDDPLVAAARAAQDDVPQTGAVEALANALIADIGERSSNVLRDVTDIYRSVITGAVARTVTGVQTRRQAAQAAFAGFLQRGVTGFTDRGGRRWRLASYVEMAVRTVTQRAAVQGEEDRLRALGVTLVSVSNAPEECELCEPFEGRVLALAGPTGDITVAHQITGRPVTVHVTATLAEARLRGLFHPNCRHSISAYIVGVSTLPRQPTADPTGRAARDKQRALERKIREQKLQAAGALTPEAKKAAGKKIRAAQAALREHLADHPTLKRLPYREQIGAGNMPPRGGNDPATPMPPPGPDDGTATPPPAPDPGPVEPDAPAATASARTREAINAALAQLPTDTDGWDAPVATMRRPIDVQIDRRRTELARAEAELARVTAAIQAEFKRKRTPKAQRDDILEARTYDARLDVRNAQASLDDITAQVDATIARGGDLPESFQLKPGYDYPRDPRGQAIAPSEWNEHLDAVLGVGERLADDLDDAIIDDPRHRELRRAMLTDEVAAAKAKREYELLHELLASIRPMGGRQTLGTATPGTRADWQTIVNDASANFPSEWLRLTDARGPLNATKDDRASFLAGRENGLGDDVMAFTHGQHRHHAPGFDDSPTEITTHELGHRMERAIPGLTQLEFTLLRRQATRDGIVDKAKRIRDIPGFGHYGPREYTLEDNWGDPYSGKTYELTRSTDHPGSLSAELFTTALQDLFGRQDEYVGEIGRRFALGVLVLLAREGT